MFLVDHDQAEPGQRRKHRRARSEHRTRLPGARTAPRRQALGIAQSGVQHGDVDVQAFAKPLHQLRRQPDLGHQHQDAAAASQRARRALQVDLGLATAGRALQHPGRVLAGRGLDLRHGRTLRAGQCRRVGCGTRARNRLRRAIAWLGRGPRRAGGRADLEAFDPSALRQRARRLAPAAEPLHDRRGGHAGAAARQQREQRLLPGRAACPLLRQRLQSRRGGAPALDPRHGRRPVAQGLGQRGGDHLAKRMVVVVGGPAQ